MAYDLFLFDLDDTLLDFKASERLSFFSTLKNLGVEAGHDELFEHYQVTNRALWKLFEESKTTKEHLKVERFRKLFEANQMDIDPELASKRYLDMLPETVVLIDYAVEICEWLSTRGEIGIITNGIHATQTERIKNSKLAPYISFTVVSEECGFAKPDVRFFEHSSKIAKKFAKASSLVIGDRVETDIQGAHNFGVDSCWFNPEALVRPETHLPPKFEIKHLSELHKILGD
jgi:2-haloacid dehalogenase